MYISDKAGMKIHKKTTLMYSRCIEQLSCLPFPPSFHSRVVFLGIFIPALFLYFYRSVPILKMKFAETFIPYFYFLDGRYKPISM